jgi:hypothetical protein
MSRIEPSFRPRFNTTFTFTGSPAPAAASMPARTRATGKSTSFIARKTSSSSESRLTVTRVSPASARICAFCARRAAFVVSVRSTSPSPARRSTSTSRSRRSKGSPPVSRSFRTPSPTKTRAVRSISSNVRSSRRGRKRYSRPKTSFGMQ